MAHNRRLLTDDDFQEAMERNIAVRVFRDDHMIEAGSVVIRFDARTVVTQSSVSELSYHERDGCEFFGMKTPPAYRNDT